MVEQVKRIVNPINDDTNIHYIFYGSNIDRFDYIKMNFDILLNQTKYVLLMWDKSHPETFYNLPSLLECIKKRFKDNNINIDIYIIQNKTDLEFGEN